MHLSILHPRLCIKEFLSTVTSHKWSSESDVTQQTWLDVHSRHKIIIQAASNKMDLNNKSTSSEEYKKNWNQSITNILTNSVRIHIMLMKSKFQSCEIRSRHFHEFYLRKRWTTTMKKKRTLAAAKVEPTIHMLKCWRTSRSDLQNKCNMDFLRLLDNRCTLLRGNFLPRISEFSEINPQLPTRRLMK